MGDILKTGGNSKFYFFLRFLVVVFVLISKAVAVDHPPIVAPQVFLIDMNTGAVLFERDADVRRGPSSMLKVMTAYLVCEKIRSGSVGKDEKILVSRKAWRMPGSRMFIREGETVSVEELLKGMLIVSGNDASVALAEGIAGDEKTFVDWMNMKVRSWGLQNTLFQNVNGLPHAEQFSTCRDLVEIGRRFIKDFPEYYYIFSQKEYTHSNIRQMNKNPLLYSALGGDGLKTGQTDLAGSGLIGSAVRNGFRLLFAMNGLPDNKTRAQDANRLIEWAFREFESVMFFSKNQHVAELDVWMGKKDKIAVVSENDVRLTLPCKASKGVQVRAVYQGPVEAPITKGQVLGHLHISFPHGEKHTIPLLAVQDVPRASFWMKIPSMIGYLLWGTRSS